VSRHILICSAQPEGQGAWAEERMYSSSGSVAKSPATIPPPMDAGSISASERQRDARYARSGAKFGQPSISNLRTTRFVRVSCLEAYVARTRPPAIEVVHERMFRGREL
jgi:hypothetical protein